MMCRFAASLLVVALMAFTNLLPAFAATDETQNEETQHQQLRELKALYESSVAANELDKLLPVLDENFSFVTFTDSEFDIKKETFELFKKSWNQTREEMLQGGSYSVVLDPERSLILGDIAVTRGIANHKIVKGDGTTYEFPGRWTVVLQQKDGNWKVVRAHSSLNAFDNPILKDVVQTIVVKAASLACLGGLVLGALATFFLVRRKTA